MPSTERKSVQFHNNDGDKITGATLAINHFDQADRTKRALKFLGLSWLAAGVAVFIPIAHFVLVPGLVFLGIYLAISTFKTSQAMESADGSCPNCNESVSIKLEAKDALPKWTYCPNCNHAIQITEV